MASLAIDLQMQLKGDGVEDFRRRYAGIGEVNGLHIVRQPLHQHVAQHGFAAAHFAANLDDAFAVGDGVDQCFKYRPAIAAAKEKIRVRRYFERCLIQSEMFVIHCFY